MKDADEEGERRSGQWAVRSTTDRLLVVPGDTSAAPTPPLCWWCSLMLLLASLSYRGRRGLIAKGERERELMSVLKDWQLSCQRRSSRCEFDYASAAARLLEAEVVVQKKVVFGCLSLSVTFDSPNWLSDSVSLCLCLMMWGSGGGGGCSSDTW